MLSGLLKSNPRHRRAVRWTQYPFHWPRCIQALVKVWRNKL